MSEEKQNQAQNNSQPNQIQDDKKSPEIQDDKKPLENLDEKALGVEIQKLILEKDEYLDGWKRAKAEFINYKKDELKRLNEIAKFANEDLIKNLIPVLDSFDLGLSVLEKEGLASKGLYMIRSQFGDVLKKFGLERIIVLIGQPFDAHLQEAIAEVESNLPVESVVEEIERGYLLYGKVIRPARVKISKRLD